MNLNYTISHSEARGIHHIHVPGLERTKFPDPDLHEPYFRLVTVFENGHVLIEAYNLLTSTFDRQHDIRFSIDDLLQ